MDEQEIKDFVEKIYSKLGHGLHPVMQHHWASCSKYWLCSSLIRVCNMIVELRDESIELRAENKQLLELLEKAEKDFYHIHCHSEDAHGDSYGFMSVLHAVLNPK